MNTHQKGFALIAAIVLVVVLAALAGFVASMVGVQAAGAQTDRGGVLVQQAAKTGLEWGGYRALRGGGFCAGLTTLAGIAAYPGVTIRVECTAMASTEPSIPGPGTVTVYRIVSTATLGSTPVEPDYAEYTRIGIFSR